LQFWIKRRKPFVNNNNNNNNDFVESADAFSATPEVAQKLSTPGL